MASAILRHEPSGSCCAPFAAEGGIKSLKNGFRHSLARIERFVLRSFFLILAHPFFSGKKKSSTKRDRAGIGLGDLCGLPADFGYLKRRLRKEKGETGKSAVEEGKRPVLYCPYIMKKKRCWKRKMKEISDI